MRNLSSYLLNEATKGNYFFKEQFLSDFQNKIVSLVSTDKVEKLSESYNNKLEECSKLIADTFLTQFFGYKIKYCIGFYNVP